MAWKGATLPSPHLLYMRPILLNVKISLWAMREVEVQLHSFWTLALVGRGCSASHAGCFILKEGACVTLKDVYNPEALCVYCTKEESVASAGNQKQHLQCPTHSFATTKTTNSPLFIMSAHLRSNTLHKGCSEALWHHDEWNMKTGRTLWQ
jgi:hypothetical protein